jgi:hypothetical protein
MGSNEPTIPANPATVRCAAEIVRWATHRALLDSAKDAYDVADAMILCRLACTYALVEQQQEFAQQLAELRAECESGRREWRDRKEGTT